VDKSKLYLLATVALASVTVRWIVVRYPKLAIF